jgi:molybdenum cofactor cytidylyltransferase
MRGHIAVIVLAAGGSKRLGRPKQLIPFAGRSLLRRAAETALACGAGPVFVVLGAAREACALELQDLRDRLALVDNPDWSRGMSSSIRAGVAAAGGADALICMTCDQPHVDAALLKEIVSMYRTRGVAAVATEYAGTIGVPVLFDRRAFSALAALEGDRGARSVLDAFFPDVATIPFPAAAFDVDAPSAVNEL